MGQNSAFNLCKNTDSFTLKIKTKSIYYYRGALGVMVIILQYGHGDTSSNPGRVWLHST